MEPEGNPFVALLLWGMCLCDLVLFVMRFSFSS
jgi:hypothetical protein